MYGVSFTYLGMWYDGPKMHMFSQQQSQHIRQNQDAESSKQMKLATLLLESPIKQTFILQYGVVLVLFDCQENSPC